MRVIFTSGDEGTVVAYGLDYFIRERKVVAFERSEGWAVVGRDPIRKKQVPFQGPGRRGCDFLFKKDP